MVLLEFTPTNHYVHTVLGAGHEAGANELCGHHIMMASSVLGINQGANGMEGRIYMPIIVAFSPEFTPITRYIHTLRPPRPDQSFSLPKAWAPRNRSVRLINISKGI